MIQNNTIAGINTDYEIQTILGNFSDDFISHTIISGLQYRFRPFGLRSPNYPQVLNSNFDNIKLNSTGFDELIEQRRLDCMENIIETICNFYNLNIYNQIPDDQLYSMACYLYILFNSEFTDRMINFYSNYIIQNIDNLLNSLSEDERIVKTGYARKVYTNQNLMIIFDNMSKIIDILAELDIPFHTLLTYISDINIANYICTYIEDAGDIYKNHFAVYIKDQRTKTDMLTAIRLKYITSSIEDQEGINPFLKGE